MKIEVKKIDNARRELNIEVSGDLVKNKFDEVFKRIARDAKVKGFRPGHLPREVLEKNFSSQAHETVLRELLPEVYSQAVKDEGLDVIDLPGISDVKLDRANFSFKATVDVTPQINLKDYKGLRIDYKKVEVSPDEVKRSIDSLKESRKADTLDDKFARGLGYPGLADFEKAIERQLALQQENQQHQKIEAKVIEDITSGLEFKLPQAMVNRQLEDLLRQAKLDLALKGMQAKDIEERQAKLRSDLEPQAKKQVRLYMVMAEIAKRENIPLDDNMPRRVVEFLLREADWNITA